MQIGGKTKIKRSSQPQVVVQMGANTNEYLKLSPDANGFIHVEWIGDPNAATKFDSKYAAKARIRDMVNVPDSRCYRELMT